MGAVVLLVPSTFLPGLDPRQTTIKKQFGHWSSLWRLVAWSLLPLWHSVPVLAQAGVPGYVWQRTQDTSGHLSSEWRWLMLQDLKQGDVPAAFDTKAISVEEGCCLSLWLLTICRNLGGCNGCKYSLSLTMCVSPGKKRWFLRQSRGAECFGWPNEAPFSPASTQEQSLGQEDVYKTVTEFTSLGDPVPSSSSQYEVVTCRWASCKWKDFPELRSKMWWSGNIAPHQRDSCCWRRFSKQPWEQCLYL